MIWTTPAVFHELLSPFLSTDAFRTLQLVLDEYVNHVVEMLQSQTIEQQYNDVLKVHGSE